MTTESTKLKMINAAGELAAEHGLDNVSTRAVAERSGENIGSIHYHFGGKDGLFEAVAHHAIDECASKEYQRLIDVLDEMSVTPIQLSKLTRLIVAEEIHDLFRVDRPMWHVQVIYHLLQRDDALYELACTEILDPSMARMAKFLHCINPDLNDEETNLHSCLIKMPVIAHANYMKPMLKRLNTDRYSETYLQTMEDLLVKQTLLLLDLPDDKTF